MGYKRHGSFMLRGGIPQRMLPMHFPLHQTVCRWFARFPRRRDLGKPGTIDLVMLDRERAGRVTGPSAGVIDTLSVKTTEAGRPRGYDARKECASKAAHHLRRKVPIPGVVD